MTILRFYSLSFGVFFILSLPVFCDRVTRVKDRIYVKSNENKQCFRILNGTHQVGCQSAQEGSHGVLHYVNNSADVDYILHDPGNHAPFIAGMDMTLFRNKELVMKLHNSGKLNGMLLFRRGSEGGFSEDSTCPNEVSSLYRKDGSLGSCKWNFDATGYRFIDFKIPIFLIYDATEQVLLEQKCYEKFNKPLNGAPPHYPLCSVELTMFNIAAGNAVRCRRRNDLMSGLESATHNCDPIGDYNVHAFLPAANKSSELKNESVLMVATRIDTFSMFSDYDPGARTVMGNIILMLTIAEALGRKDTREYLKRSQALTGRHLMPVFFAGESLDYIGSSRMVWNMTKHAFPYALTDKYQDQAALVKLEHLAMILELNQVASGKNGFYPHIDSSATESAKEKISNAIETIANYSSGKLNSKLNQPLPPSSVQSFLKANRKIPAVVITDHKTNFENKFYNSFSDDPVSINKDAFKESAIQLANGVLKYLFDWISNGAFQPEYDADPEKWQANSTVMTKLMDCFWSWPEYMCPMFDRINISFPAGYYRKGSDGYSRTYSGPLRFSALSRRYINITLSYFLGIGDRKLMPNQTTSCDSAGFNRTSGTLYNYVRMVDLINNATDATYCTSSTVMLTEAMSPAFYVEGYDFTSGEYSTWMESSWASSLMRIFLRADPKWEVSILVIGILTTLLSLVIVFIVARSSDTCFAPNAVAIL